MEGSVKSLIQSEEQAKAIVQQAYSEKNDKLREAKTNADQIVNRIRTEKEQAYASEEAKVSGNQDLPAKEIKRSASSKDTIDSLLSRGLKTC